jgi:hypothetical protein
MEYIHFFQIIPQVFPFVRPEYSQRKTDERPKVDHRVITAIMLTQFMNLGMAVMTSGNAVIRSRGFNLIIFQLSILQALFFEPGLQKSAAAAAAVVIRFIGLHVNEIFFTHHRLDHETKIICDRIAIALSNNLARILNREFDFQVLVPVGIDLQVSFTDPFGIIFIDVLNFEVVFDVEFFQSGPD